MGYEVNIDPTDGGLTPQQTAAERAAALERANRQKKLQEQYEAEERLLQSGIELNPFAWTEISNTNSNSVTSSLRPLPTNTDRVVEIEVIDPLGSIDVNERNWRYFLKRILSDNVNNSNGDSNRQSMFEGLSTKAFDYLTVPQDVCLVVDSFPAFDGQLAGRLNSPLGQLLQKAGGKAKIAMDVVNGVSAAVSLFKGDQGSSGTANMFAPYLINVPAYNVEATQGLTWKSTFKFALGQYGLWNAKNEVVLPVLNLLAPSLLRYIDPAMQQGPFPTVFDLAAKLLLQIWNNITGDAEDSATFSDVWKSTDGDSFLTRLATTIEHIILTAYSGFMYKVQYGRFLRFNNVMIVDAKVTWGSNEVDQYGYPVAASVDLSFKTIAPPSLTSSSYNNMAVRFGVTDSKTGII